MILCNWSYFLIYIFKFSTLLIFAFLANIKKIMDIVFLYMLRAYTNSQKSKKIDPPYCPDTYYMIQYTTVLHIYYVKYEFCSESVTRDATVQYIKFNCLILYSMGTSIALFLSFSLPKLYIFLLCPLSLFLLPPFLYFYPPLLSPFRLPFFLCFSLSLTLRYLRYEPSNLFYSSIFLSLTLISFLCLCSHFSLLLRVSQNPY